MLLWSTILITEADEIVWGCSRCAEFLTITGLVWHRECRFSLCHYK